MFTSKEGHEVPQVTFPTRQGDAWVNVTSDDIFKDKTVIVFSLTRNQVPSLLLVLQATCHATMNYSQCSKSMA